MRPTTFKVDNAIYWTIRTYTDAGVLVDADSTPSIAVRENGQSITSSVTVTKRTATTGIYDCEYNPSGEVEGDCFTIEETATISLQPYENAWSIEARAAERGTDNASTFDPDNDVVANVTLVDTTTDLTNGGGGGGGDATAANQTSIINAISALNDFDPAVDEVTTDTASRNASKADVSTLATQASVDSVDGDIQTIGSDVSTILADTNELQTNQGDWATATGFSTFDASTDQVVASNMRGTDGANTVAPDNTSIAAILVDTNELQGNQGDWATATGFSTFDHTSDAVITDTASRNASKADVSGLSTFDAGTDPVVASNMRGTDNAILAASAPANWSTLIVGTGGDSGKVTTSNPASGGGSAHTAQDVADLILVTPSNKLATDGSGNVEANNMRGTDGANTVAPTDVSSDVAAILADTNELQLNQGDWLTADLSTLNDIAASDVVSAMQAVSGDFKADVSGLSTFDHTADEVTTDNASRVAARADVSGLSTFDHTSDQVVASNMRGTDNALLASSAPSNWSNLIVGTGSDAGKVTTSNPASGGGSAHTAQDVANLILITPANKLATDGSGNVEANNMRGTDGANTVAPVDVSTAVALILADSNQLVANQGDWLTATGFATPADVSTSQGVITTAIGNLNDFDPATDVIGRVTLVDTTTDLTNQNSGGTNPADIYNYFTAAAREDAFKADLSGVSSLVTGVDTKVTNLNDFNPATTSVTTDNASRDASKADISTLATITQINALDVKVTTNGVKLDGTVKKNQNYRYTNYGTGTGFDLVTITEA